MLKLISENDAVEEPGFNIDNVTDSREKVAIINDYEEVIKTHNKKMIVFNAK